MVTCKECRFWEPVDDLKSPGYQAMSGTGQCGCPKFYYGYGRPNNLDSDAVRIEDDEGWGCFTGPDFGCIHGENDG